MGSIWLLGFIAFILYRVFNAGMNSKSLFYRPPGRYETEPQFSENLVMGYVFTTFGFAVTWIISLPLYGIYLLGKRYQKEV